MMKLVIVLAVCVAAVSCESDVDKIVGEGMPMAASFKLGGQLHEMCEGYRLNKIENKCTCKSKTDLPVLLVTENRTNNTRVLIPIIVRNEEDVASALEIKTADCLCDLDEGITLQIVVLRVVNDNYFLQYYTSESNSNLVILHRKKVASRSDFEAMIKANGFDKTNYTLMCDEFTE